MRPGAKARACLCRYVSVDAGLAYKLRKQRSKPTRRAREPLQNKIWIPNLLAWCSKPVCNW